MKNSVKTTQIIIIGLLIVLVFYPFIHEVGHSIMALVFGARVIEFNMYPSPNVVCDANTAETLKMIIIISGGMLLPFILSIIIRPKRFWSFYVCLLTRWLNMLTFIISLSCMPVYHLAGAASNEDIIQIVKLAPEYEWLCVFILVCLFTISLALFIKLHPIKRCVEYFGI